MHAAGVIFNQIAPITLSFAVISLLEAAVRWELLDGGVLDLSSR